ncbi:MAG: hypothetical protein ACPF9D_02315, partial [Owenweeksia sp.]
MVVLLGLGFNALATHEVSNFTYQPTQVYTGSIQSLEATPQSCGSYTDIDFEHLVSLYLDPDYIEPVSG